MLHLALVQNLLNSIGAAPRLGRPNFRCRPTANPSGVQMALVPFGEAALRHFAYLERPEGMEWPRRKGSRPGKARALPHDEAERSCRTSRNSRRWAPDRSIEEGLGSLAERTRERACSSAPDGPGDRGHFRFPRAVGRHRSRDRARGDRHDRGAGRGRAGRVARRAFGRLVRMLDEYLASGAGARLRARPPGAAATSGRWQPARTWRIIGHGFTARCADLLNATYEVLLQLLSRYFAHTDETPEPSCRR